MLRFSHFRLSFRSLTIYLLLLVLLLIIPVIFVRANTPTPTATVSNTAMGTMQTQLSTNIVTWGSDFSQIPNGQASLNALQLPLVRLHVGDDGGPAMPEINQGSWDMTTLNTMVNDVFASGQRPMMNIKFAPDWMWTCYPNSVGVNGTSGQGTVTDQTFQTFAQYMARLASYYNKGSLTEGNGTVLTNPAGTSHKITYWELWNEPDLSDETPCHPANWDAALTPAQYLTMWNAVTAAMSAVDPTIKFIGPADAGGQFDSGLTSDAYIDNIMQSPIKPYAISFHGYGYWAQEPDKYYFDGDGSLGGGGITDMVNIARNIRAKYPTMPIWLTEVNVDADWFAQGENDDELSLAWWGAMVQQLVPYGIGMIDQFDYTGANVFGLIDGEGVVTNGNTANAAGKPMLPYYILQQFDKAFPQGSTILSSSSTQAGILSLAVKKPDGNISVMIVNRRLPSNTVQSSCGTGGVASTVTVDLSALNPSAITLTQLDKRNVDCSTWYGIAPTTQALGTGQPVTISFPGYGIAILNVVTNGTAVTSSATATSTLTPTTALGTTATPTPTIASPFTPTPTATATSGSSLTLYDNAVSSAFTDNSFGYSSRTPCDTKVYVTAPCSYAITYQAYGAIEFLDKHGSINPNSYKSLDYNINTGGQPINDFGVIISDDKGGWINEVVLSSSDITQSLPGGWVHISIPLSQLDSTNTPIGTIDLENALDKSTKLIHIDDVHFVGS